MIKIDLLEAIATGLVEELTRRGLRAQAYPPTGPEDAWHVRYGHCLMILHSESILFNAYFFSVRSEIRYEDPGMIEQLLIAIKQVESRWVVDELGLSPARADGTEL